MKQRRVETIAVATSVLWAITMTSIVIMMAITVTSCDEGMNMVGPVLPGPGEEPTVNPGDDQEQTTNGEVKNPETPEPTPTLTLTIDTAVTANGGSITISGTSTELAAGETVTVTLADTVTVTTMTDTSGAWSVTVSAKEVTELAAGTVAIKAVAGKATSESSFEYAPPPEQSENDFVGQVVTPIQGQNQRGASRGNPRAVPGVTLTVISGERAGEQSVTDENGNYLFPDATGEIVSLRLRTEKEGFEPKEVIAHRQESTTTIDDGIAFTMHFAVVNPQETPGTIVIGHEWPDKVRFILEETPLPHDLLLVRVEDISKYSGLYGYGVITIQEGNCLLHTIAHELAHAHQHAVAVHEMGPDAYVAEWKETQEGKAYATAWEKDMREVGKANYDEGHYLTPFENMAKTANEFWNTGGRFDTRCFSTTKLAEEAPNRFKWAQKWLSKKYD